MKCMRDYVLYQSAAKVNMGFHICSFVRKAHIFFTSSIIEVYRCKYVFCSSFPVGVIYSIFSVL